MRRFPFGPQAPQVPTEEGAPTERERDLYMVKGRNYCLTLVREGPSLQVDVAELLAGASTVLSKEDLNRPKGEKWEAGG